MTLAPGKEEILEAAERIAPFTHRTPLLTSQTLSRLTACTLYFKCENFQKAGAFKSRGAVNAVFALPDKEVQNGVCTHSSGNHAGALSRAAKLRKVPAHIVMPSNSNPIKVAAVREYGGIITFCEPTLEARESTLQKVREETGATEIHPYNDHRIIAGQATAALEVFDSGLRPDIIMAPVGGGGLLSGTALATHLWSPSTRVIAAEPAGADDAFRSFTSGTFQPSVNPRTIADGLLTSLGSLTWPIIQKQVHEIITVEENTIVQAMLWIWERMKIIIEPSSAVPLAAIIEKPEIFRGHSVVVILSGGNADLHNLPWMQI
jgi:threonine dehydratase